MFASSSNKHGSGTGSGSTAGSGSAAVVDRRPDAGVSPVAGGAGAVTSTIDGNVDVFHERGQDSPDRRRSTREPMVTRGTLRAVTALASEAPLEVLVIDVSLHGVGLRSAESLEVGDLYFVEIGAGPLHLTSRGRIVRCRLRRDGNFDIGAEFC
jgi:hypothetical protein